MMEIRKTYRIYFSLVGSSENNEEFNFYRDEKRRVRFIKKCKKINKGDKCIFNFSIQASERSYSKTIYGDNNFSNEFVAFLDLDFIKPVDDIIYVKYEIIKIESGDIDIVLDSNFESE